MINAKRIFKYLASREGISDAANIFTIGAFGIAFYAIFNPGTVSSYLENMASEAEQTNVILSSVDGSAKSINSNTSVLAGEVPYWLEFKEFTHIRSAPLRDMLEIVLTNNSNYSFSDVSLRLLYADGELAYEQEDFVIPPREDVHFFESKVDKTLGVVCLSGTSQRTKVKQYEYRYVSDASTSEGRMYFSEWSVGEKPERSCR